MKRGTRLLIIWLSGEICAAAPVAGAAEVVPQAGMVRVVELSGSPYELGLQHGRLLREEVRGAAATTLGYFRRYGRIPLIRVLLVNLWLDRAWRQAEPHVPADVLEELQGLSEGSGVPLRELCRLHAIPDRTYSCASFAAWGRATQGGHLVQLRNLDWNIDVGIQRYATVFVVRPEGRRAFVHAGWAGFIGVLTGVNDAGLSIGQIGAETVDATFRGEPMAFLMRRVLEDAGNVDEAAALIRGASRTVGVNYVLGDAKARRGLVVETTHTQARVFEADDPAEHAVSYARPLADAVFRADTTMDPEIRDRQLASNGNPQRPGLEDPAGSSAYETRYLGQAQGLATSFGEVNARVAMEIARSIAPSSNLQSVVFAWPDLWVANAQGTTPAARTTYHHFDVTALLKPHPGTQ